MITKEERERIRSRWRDYGPIVVGLCDALDEMEKERDAAAERARKAESQWEQRMASPRRLSDEERSKLKEGRALHLRPRDVMTVEANGGNITETAWCKNGFNIIKIDMSHSGDGVDVLILDRPRQ